MPPGRPKVELDCFREEIQEMRASDTIDGIVNWLSNVHNITVSRSTMKRKLQEWQTIIQERTEDSPQLRARLAVLFYEVCLKDDDMMRVLIEEGYQITLTGLVRLRKELNMTRKVDFRHREEADRLLLDIAQKELDKGEIDGYGISHLYTYFRTKQFNISRDRLYAAIKYLDPVGVQNRTNDIQRHRGEYIVPGPNSVWSIDGHCKLDFVGIEIYGAIDAYSRCVIWLYVGITARTQISVLCQYLKTVEDSKIIPGLIRADRGIETPMIADAHFKLSQAVRTKVDGSDIEFEDSFRYGTSTKNVRIEAWWAQMSKSQTYRWREYFEKLVQDNLYDKAKLEDRICLLFIYMPILRREVHAFVKQWNVHRIRKQPNRPHSVAGQPWMLYNHPSPPIQNCGYPVNSEALNGMIDDVRDWDIDEYLPAQTLQWCHAKLKEISGHEPLDLTSHDAFPNGERKHCVIYLELKGAIANHLRSGALPLLEESVKPIGARQWQPSHDVVREDPNGGELASLDADFIIAGEGRDEMAVDEDFVQFLDDI